MNTKSSHKLVRVRFAKGTSSEHIKNIINASKGKIATTETNSRYLTYLIDPPPELSPQELVTKLRRHVEVEMAVPA